MTKIIFFVILAVIWLMIVFNRSLSRSLRRNKPKIEFEGIGSGWGTEDCFCGTARPKWKALAMNRPDNTVLLKCPQCRSLWEEQMSLYGNKWRKVEPVYAREQYNYKDFYGRYNSGQERSEDVEP